MVLAMVIALLGPGAFSIDARMFGRAKSSSPDNAQDRPTPKNAESTSLLSITNSGQFVTSLPQKSAPRCFYVNRSKSMFDSTRRNFLRQTALGLAATGVSGFVLCSHAHPTQQVNRDAASGVLIHMGPAQQEVAPKGS